MSNEAVEAGAPDEYVVQVYELAERLNQTFQGLPLNVICAAMAMIIGHAFKDDATILRATHGMAVQALGHLTCTHDDEEVTIQ